MTRLRSTPRLMIQREVKAGFSAGMVCARVATRRRQYTTERHGVRPYRKFLSEVLDHHDVAIETVPLQVEYPAIVGSNSHSVPFAGQRRFVEPHDFPALPGIEVVVFEVWSFRIALGKQAASEHQSLRAEVQ